MTDMTVSKTILSQLGGQRFLVMTGAKNLIGSDNSLTMTLPGDPGFVKDRIRYVRVTLTPRDDYKLEFLKTKRNAEAEVFKTEDGVYVDALRSTFTAATGLDCTL